MNNDMIQKNTMATLILSLLFVCVATAVPRDATNNFISTAEQLRDLRKLLSSSRKMMPPLKLKEVSEKLIHTEADSPPNTAIMLYLLGRATIRSKHKTAQNYFLNSARFAAAEPESILALLELHSHSAGSRIVHEKYLVSLIPLVGWTREIDAYQSYYDGRFFDKPSPPRARVPTIDLPKILTVSSLLKKSHLYDLAWRAYAEAIYAGFIPPWTKQSLDQTWLSPEAAESWYKAAECARLAGKQELAWGYLMKAAVFGSDDLYKKAQVTAERWSEHAKPVAPRQVDPKVKRQALVKIVHLYMDMNADPRAWELIDSHREDFDHPDELRKQVEAHWRAVVKNVSRAATKVTLYGHEVYPHGDPMDVTIPWALSDEAIASVQKRLQKDRKKH